MRASVPADAFTAGALGTERIGNGAVIRDDGLVLTIGYLITEAEMVWLISADGAGGARATRWPTTRPRASGWCRRWGG